MTANNTNKPTEPVNHNLSVAFINSDAITHYEAMGYRLIALKIPDPSELSVLTKQEREVLSCLVLSEMSTKDIASQLQRDERYIRTLLSQIRSKFDCQSNLQLALKIKKLGLDIFLP